MLNLIEDYGIIRSVTGRIVIQHGIFKKKTRLDAAHAALASIKQIEYTMMKSVRLSSNEYGAWHLN